MENSDWEEVGPEELGKEGAGEQEEAEKSKQSITPKVLDLMVKISEYGYLTMHEVQFVYGNKTWAYKVIKGLRCQGFIAEHETLMYPKTAYYLMPKGYRILGKFGRLKVGIRFKPERYSIFIFKHRMASAKVGLLLEKHPLVHEFLPESRLFKKQRDKLYKLCDGEFWYRVPGHEKSDRVGLEVELTLKSNQRLDETFHELARRGDLDQIWWICANDNVMRAMRREVIIRYTPESHRHFFALLNELLAAKGKAELMDAQGVIFSIDPDKPTLLPSKLELPPQLTVQKPSAQAEVPKQPQPAEEIGLDLESVVFPNLLRPPERRMTIEEHIALLYADLRTSELARPVRKKSRLERLRDSIDEAWFWWDRWSKTIGIVALGIVSVVIVLFIDWPLLLDQTSSPGAPVSIAPLRWHDRTVYHGFASGGDFQALVPRLQSKGNQYRMPISLEKVAGDTYGYSLKAVRVTDAKGKLLAQSKVMGTDTMFGTRGSWSGVLDFRAPAAARKFVVTLFLDGPWKGFHDTLNMLVEFI